MTPPSAPPPFAAAPDAAPPPSPLFRAAVALYAALCVGFALFQVARFRIPFPYFDVIVVERFIKDTFLPGWSPLTALRTPMNEHHPAFPVYVWAADHAWFASEGTLVLAVMLALWLATCAFLIGWLRRPALATRRDMVLAAAVPLVLFWPAHHENLVWSVQLNTIMSIAAFVAAVWALMAAERHAAAGTRRSLAWLALCAALLIVSTYSLSFGVIGWATLLVYAAVRRWPWRQLLPFAASAVPPLWLYASLWKPSPAVGNLVRLIGRPDILAEYYFMLLGVPVRKLIEWPLGAPGPGPTIALGAIVFVLVAVAAWKALIMVPAALVTRAAQGDRAWVLIGIFGLGSALILAVGRSNYPLEQMGVPRYTIIPCLVWLAAAAYWLPRLPSSRLFRRAGAAIAMLLAVVVAISYVGQIGPLRQFATMVRTAAALELSGISHPDLADRLIDRRDDRQWLFASLRQRGHRFFREPALTWVGRHRSELFGPPLPGRCIGHADRTTRVGGGYVELFGWVLDNDTGGPPRWLVVTDGAGIIRGLAGTGFDRTDVMLALRRWWARSAGWRGAAHLPGGTHDIYGVTHDNRLCGPIPKP